MISFFRMQMLIYLLVAPCTVSLAAYIISDSEQSARVPIFGGAYTGGSGAYREDETRTYQTGQKSTTNKGIIQNCADTIRATDGKVKGITIEGYFFNAKQEYIFFSDSVNGLVYKGAQQGADYLENTYGSPWHSPGGLSWQSFKVTFYFDPASRKLLKANIESSRGSRSKEKTGFGTWSYSKRIQHICNFSGDL